MKQLTAPQMAIIARVVDELRGLTGVEAIVLGGSHARGRARPDSDIDIGLYYRPESPFSIDEVRRIASCLNDMPDPVVSGILDWGRWVDGGAWLTIEGQRVDLLYRSLAMVEATLAEAQAGRFQIDYEQQPPFGFFGPTLLGEVAIAQPLHDPRRILADLKAEVSPMPEALADAVIQNRLWSVEFGLAAFAGKYAANGDVHGVAGCVSRFAQALVLTLFALNRAYPLNDKTTLSEIEAFTIGPKGFGPRLRMILANVGSTPETLAASVNAIGALFEDVRALAGPRYAPTWRV
ncbi:nucleotidyltransferase domain-containing protein [Novosphingobium aerophilum]|uniref:Nucleotidyltransferase domain-containing protein n=1 Tax=Novosphingobium aerophilum TaxID=2839843 RepID=A0A7X1KCP0_9SPHN|nr:nucleotidyltransferase domain-containing protein [Novosphingobium aerophilum]MBC2652488.1 nucleotidyltransferase domain-containing protein [Novosphingobium aerophilum]